MRRLLTLLACLILTLSAVAALAAYPKPSPYPVSWELKFEHGLPQRIVVTAPGSDTPKAYWYLTYTVTNKTNREQTFLPMLELLTDDGRVIRSDNTIPLAAFEAIKAREKKAFLEQQVQIGGEIRLGEDQARDGVAIWAEPMAPKPERMGTFSIFVSGLSGETVIMKKVNGDLLKVQQGQELQGVDAKELVTLRKTLQIKYLVRGDEFYPGEDEVNQNAEEWVMR